jgi:predicted metal-dependent phosphoesterase TrpH
MRNPHPRFTCFPSVVCVGKETKVTIYPRDTSRRFHSEKEYELCVLGLRDDELDYHAPVPYEHPYEIENGCMKFTYTFEKEQEYSIRFREKNGKTTKLSMYAVEQDLYELRPLKGDLHTHSYYSDGEDGIAMVPSDYREEGFDFFALTDHNRMFPSKLVNELYKDIPLGIHMMTGEEVHTPGSILHIVHVGGENSVCERYILNREQFEEEVSEIEKTLSYIPDQYRRRTAMAKWSCEKIREEGGLSILAHPFWQPNRYNVSKEFLEILFEEQMFDAFELAGGVKTTGLNLQVALWQEQAMKGNCLPVVGSSDSHNHDFVKDSLGRRFTIVFAKSNTTEDILEAIREGYSVAAELPMVSEEDIRFYGAPLRLVLFAHFLFKNYFNETWRLCIGEGILMRRYAEGEPVGDTLAALSETVEDFYKRFYGYADAPTLTERQQAFADQCLVMQRNCGPETKGSALHVYGGNERRE